MRQLISKILTVVLILNLMASMSVSAREEAMLYIDGDKAGVPVTESGGAVKAFTFLLLHRKWDCCYGWQKDAEALYGIVCCFCR